MNCKSNPRFSALWGAVLLATGLLGACAVSAAENVGREWDRGCDDAKGGSYDRSKHSSAYEDGWQACKKQAAAPAPAAGHHNKHWKRGCDDAKMGSYDRSRHSQDYEDGWQACKKQ